MKAKIEIEMDNDAFRNTTTGHCAANELARILGRLEDDVSRYMIGEVGHHATCTDYNGNTVGKLDIVES
jgi:nitrous oxide reductase